LPLLRAEFSNNPKARLRHVVRKTIRLWQLG